MLPTHSTIGNYSLIHVSAVGTRCANGDRLVNFASANRLVVSSTRFQHPQRHLVTWFSNDARTRNQIDHRRSRWASSAIDCRAYNGAQTGSEHGSDHAMVRAHLRLRMKAAHIPNRPAKLDTAKVKTAALEHLRLDLRNRFEGLQLDEDASLEDEWRELKDAVADASQAHLGKTRRRRRDWVTGETIALVEQARLARIQSAPNHRERRRQTTRALRRDRNAFWKVIAEETERAAECGDTRKLYQMLKSVSHRPAGVGEVLLERDGSHPRSSQKAISMERALQGSSQSRSIPEHCIFTTEYPRGGKLPL